jgi:uridylate kinase
VAPDRTRPALRRPRGLGRRVLLKLSGELIAGERGAGLTQAGLECLADQIAGARLAGAQTAVVIGGGNLVRGSALPFLPRSLCDGIGMLGTLMNALALQGTLAQRGLAATVLTAFPAPRFADLYRPERAVALLEAGEVVLLAGGTGQTHLTTDTAAALRAVELGCTLLVKGTKVDGVYSADPVRQPRARRFERLTHAEVLRRRLRVMDLTAVTLCMENDLPIVVLNATQSGSVERCLRGRAIGTLILPTVTGKAAR